jgi:DNA polymerase III epsilon subunit family exonuclease
VRWKNLPIVAFDTETTGLQPFAGDRIIEVAAVVLRLDPDGRVASREDHAWLVNPGMPIPRMATEISGISDKDVASAPPFSDVAEQVYALLANAVTVAHNYPFDMAFLTQEFLRLGRTWPEPLAEVDTVDLSMRHFSDARSHKLADVCERLQISLEGAHRATNDAAACGRCFTEMARRHDVGDDLQAMLDWGNAIGRPPEDGPLGAGASGRVVFLEGPHRGEPISLHPIHLAWMEKARARDLGGWSWRYPESTRRWARRWLDVRGAGRARQNPKSFHAGDWTLDSCVAVDRRTSA